MSFKDRWKIFIEKLKTPHGKKVFAIIIVVIVILGIAGWAIYNRYFKKDIVKPIVTSTSSIAVKTDKPVDKEASKLDGVSYEKDLANRHPIAVMVENHPDARPQAGLDKASVIYEAEAEGGITRFMAIFGAYDANKVGPVRSARTYYVDWNDEYDGFYAHVGGNADALALIEQLGIKDLNQFTYGTQAYWREPEDGKAIEHTMFTDTEKLRNIAKDNGWSTSTSDFTALPFKTDASKEARPEKQTITVNFSSSLYNVQWNYDKTDNIYKRTMAGEAHNDRISGTQLSAKNIIVQYIDRTPTTNGDESAWEVATIGEGKAEIYLDGKKIDATWKKSSHKDRTKYYDATGAEVKLNPGVTWYEVVPNGAVVTAE